ncbi:MAG: exodeoxyribonuclease V subunit alpha [Actinobacteria bacterium]|jgi:exodeoxyribonuclease V alpha subunit|nr:exodeoxyribonuclease V subunit alpha [Actinomycetota bacterium]
MSARRELLQQLQPWREAGVLDAAEVHIASSLASRVGESRPHVVLALALAVAAPRSGHVALDPEHARESAMREAERVDDDARATVAALAWPVETAAWLREVQDSPLTPDVLRVEHGLIYLRRFHDLEISVADRLIALASEPTSAPEAIDDLSERMHLDDGQRQAVRTCLASRLGVLVGGPGTGKTRTVATILAALLRDEGATPRIALAAPTGKAAARMGESIANAAALLETSDPDLADSMRQVRPSTVHRLLGVRRGSAAFRHNASDPLHHDVVIIDEASMMSLPLSASLLEALSASTRLILVGDPDQLASVEAGSVLADLVAARGPISSCVAELTANHRFGAGSAIGELAAAVRRGDVEGTRRALDTGGGASLHSSGSTARSIVEPVALAMRQAALAGDQTLAAEQLDSVRVLCAHRRGPAGVARWNSLVESWLGDVRPFSDYAGRPVMVTVNDAPRRLFNGDIGVVVEQPETGALEVVIPDGESIRHVPRVHLGRVETVHALTIHKSQGSEFDRVVVVLPSADSLLATRELLYTAITRARSSVTLIGSLDAVLAAVSRPTRRASGLRARLDA